MNNRYNNYLPIVITTNYNRNQLRERLCVNKNYSMVDSIISRLYEMCGGIEIKDDDHRMSKIPNLGKNDRSTEITKTEDKFNKI